MGRIYLVKSQSKLKSLLSCSHDVLFRMRQAHVPTMQDSYMYFSLDASGVSDYDQQLLCNCGSGNLRPRGAGSKSSKKIEDCVRLLRGPKL